MMTIIVMIIRIIMMPVVRGVINVPYDSYIFQPVAVKSNGES